jgi:hypothetical protein
MRTGGELSPGSEGMIDRPSYLLVYRKQGARSILEFGKMTCWPMNLAQNRGSETGP